MFKGKKAAPFSKGPGKGRKKGSPKNWKGAKRKGKGGR